MKTKAEIELDAYIIRLLLGEVSPAEINPTQGEKARGTNEKSRTETSN